MTLRIIAAEEQLRTLKHSVQTLSKFGGETVLEARPGLIHFRSVNQSKSAYVRMTFNSTFFDVYELFEQPVLSASILSKSLVASLKTQRICRAIFEVFTQHNRMVVFVDCENGLQKRFEFDLIDTDALQAQINFDLYPVRITAEAQELSRLLSSFQQSLEEMTLIANPDAGPTQGGPATPSKSCQLHSFYDPQKIDMEGNLSKLLHTQLSLNAQQHFLEYQHTGRETVDVTFNLRDFKVVLGYCASTRNNLTVLVSRAGEPLAILPAPMNEHMNAGFTSEFVLATMVDSCVDEFGQHLSALNKTQQQQQQQQQQRVAERGSHQSMNTADVASHLVALNGNNSNSNAKSVLGRPGAEGSVAKRLKVGQSQDTETMTLSMSCNDKGDGGNGGDEAGRDGEEDNDSEVPATPPHERRLETCIQNWS